MTGSNLDSCWSYAGAALDLSNLGIATISEDAFAGLFTLTELNLSSNALTALPGELFNNLWDVYRIDLTDNVIASVDPQAFDGCESLREIHMSGNELSEVPAGMLFPTSGKLPLTILFLEGMQLTWLPVGFLSGHADDLTDLRLSGNPWLSGPGGTCLVGHQVELHANTFCEAATTVFTCKPAAFSESSEAAGASLCLSASGAAHGVTYSYYLEAAEMPATAEDPVVGPFALWDQGSFGDGLTTSATKFFAASKLPLSAGFRFTVWAVDSVSGERTPNATQVFALSSLPSGCTSVGTGHELSSCAAFAGPELRLGSRGIKSIAEGAFAGLSGVYSLDLSGNVLTELPPNPFVGLSNLQGLVLARNSALGGTPFKMLDGSTFAGLSELRFVDMTECGLLKIPREWLHQLHLVEAIVLTRNQLTYLPGDMLKGQRFPDYTGVLDTLELSHNRLESLPEQLFANVSLRHAMFTANDLTTVPEKLLRGDVASHLEELDLSDNHLTWLPTTLLHNLTRLDTLTLSDNDLTGIDPRWFVGLDKLYSLKLEGNHITELPPHALGAPGALPQLYELILYENGMVSMSEDAFVASPALHKLDIGLNDLETLPSALLKPLPKLGKVYLDSNQLASLPAGFFRWVDDPASMFLQLNSNPPSLTSMPCAVGSVKSMLGSVIGTDFCEEAHTSLSCQTPSPVNATANATFCVDLEYEAQEGYEHSIYWDLRVDEDPAGDPVLTFAGLQGVPVTGIPHEASGATILTSGTGKVARIDRSLLPDIAPWAQMYFLAQVQFTDVAAGVSGQSAEYVTYPWAYDVTPPEAQLIDYPPADSAATTAEFLLGCSEQVPGLPCSFLFALDGGPFVALNQHSSDDNGGDGGAGAGDGSGAGGDGGGARDDGVSTSNPEELAAEAARYPTAIIVQAAPSERTSNRSAHFEFMTEPAMPRGIPPQLFTSLDGAPAQALDGMSFDVADLEDGRHTLVVTVTSENGPIAASPVVFAWQVDTTLPTVTLLSGPETNTSSLRGDFIVACDAQNAGSGETTSDAALRSMDACGVQYREWAVVVDGLSAEARLSADTGIAKVPPTEWEAPVPGGGLIWAASINVAALAEAAGIITKEVTGLGAVERHVVVIERHIEFRAVEASGNVGDDSSIVSKVWYTGIDTEAYNVLRIVVDSASVAVPAAAYSADKVASVLPSAEPPGVSPPWERVWFNVGIHLVWGEQHVGEDAVVIYSMYGPMPPRNESDGAPPGPGSGYDGHADDDVGWLGPEVLVERVAQVGGAGVGISLDAGLAEGVYTLRLRAAVPTRAGGGIHGRVTSVSFAVANPTLAIAGVDNSDVSDSIYRTVTFQVTPPSLAPWVSVEYAVLPTGSQLPPAPAVAGVALRLGPLSVGQQTVAARLLRRGSTLVPFPIPEPGAGAAGDVDYHYPPVGSPNADSSASSSGWATASWTVKSAQDASVVFTGLPDGPHDIDVVAIDAAGNAATSPETYHWVVDTLAPRTEIRSVAIDVDGATLELQPGDSTTAASASWQLVAMTGDTECTDCRVQFGSLRSNTIEDVALAIPTMGNVTEAHDAVTSVPLQQEGVYSLRAAAVDAAGNVDDSPAFVVWRVDRTAPAVSVGVGSAIVVGGDASADDSSLNTTLEYVTRDPDLVVQLYGFDTEAVSFETAVLTRVGSAPGTGVDVGALTFAQVSGSNATSERAAATDYAVLGADWQATTSSRQVAFPVKTVAGVPLGELPQGRSVLVVRATDSAGNTAVIEVGITADTLPPANVDLLVATSDGGTKRSAVLDSHPTLGWGTNATEVWFWPTADAGTGSPLVPFRLAIMRDEGGDAPTGSGSGVEHVDHPVVIEARDITPGEALVAAGLADHRYEAHLTVADVAGNAVTIVVPFFVDTLPPSTTVLQAPPKVSATRTLELKAVPSDNTIGGGTTFVSGDEGMTWVETSAADGFVSVVVDRDGDVDILLKSVDAAGNVQRSVQEVGVFVATVAPQLRILSAPGTFTSRHDNIVVNFTVTDAVSAAGVAPATVVAVARDKWGSVDDHVLGSVLPNGATAVWNGLKDSEWSLELKVESASGRESEWMKTITTVDTVAPALSSVAWPVLTDINNGNEEESHAGVSGSSNVTFAGRCQDDTTACVVQAKLSVLELISDSACDTGAGRAAALTGPAAKFLDWATLSMIGAVEAPAGSGHDGGFSSWMLLPDGSFQASLRALDSAGFASTPVTGATMFVDTVAPAQPTVSLSVDPLTSQTSVLITVSTSDRSPGMLFLEWSLDGQPWTVSPFESSGAASSATSAATVHTTQVWAGKDGPALSDGTHTVDARVRDAAGNLGPGTPTTWTILTTPPDTRFLFAPARKMGLEVASFIISAVDGTSGAALLIGDGAQIGLEVKLATDTAWWQVCGSSMSGGAGMGSGTGSSAGSGSGAGGGTVVDHARMTHVSPYVGTIVQGGIACHVEVRLSTPGQYTFSARATAGHEGVLDVEPAVYAFEYAQCTADDTFAIVNTTSGSLVCEACPEGAYCGSATVTAQSMGARVGFWTSGEVGEDGIERFYECPKPTSCLGGGNGTAAATCAPGYTGLLCAVCEDGYFEQWNSCVRCPDDEASVVFTILGLVAAAAVIGAVMFRLRDDLPVDYVEIMVAFGQVVGSANTSLQVPWPPAFDDALSAVKVLLLDVVTLTRAGCASGNITYYTSLGITILLFFVAVVAALSVSLSIEIRHVQKRAAAGLLPGIAPHTASAGLDARNGPGAADAGGGGEEVVRRSVPVLLSARAALRRVDWRIVMKPVDYALLLVYPGVSVKLLRLFPCEDIDGVPHLSADVRLECYTSEWQSWAGVVVPLLLFYTVGFPIIIVHVLRKRRKHLLEAKNLPLKHLWHAYGHRAWPWVSVELMRKLALTGLVALFNPRSPVQVTFAVLVSAFSHVAHAMWRPFANKVAYRLQHLSLSATTVLFVTGLLLKVDEEEFAQNASGGLVALEVLAVTLPVLFLFCAVGLIARHVVLSLRRRAQGASVKGLAKPWMRSAAAKITRAGSGHSTGSAHSSGSGGGGGGGDTAPDARPTMQQRVQLVNFGAKRNGGGAHDAHDEGAARLEGSAAPDGRPGNGNGARHNGNGKARSTRRARGASGSEVALNPLSGSTPSPVLDNPLRVAEGMDAGAGAPRGGAASANTRRKRRSSMDGSVAEPPAARV